MRPPCLDQRIAELAAGFDQERAGAHGGVADLEVENLLGTERPARFRAEVWQGHVDGLAVALLKPQTFVNESGPAVQAALRTFGLQASDLIVVHDDLDLAFARLRVRPGGGSGGHNGMRSIIRTLGTDAVERVKIGLGRPPAGVDPADYVLGRFTPAERDAAAAAVERAADAVRTLMTTDVDSTMRQFN